MRLYGFVSVAFIQISNFLPHCTNRRWLCYAKKFCIALSQIKTKNSHAILLCDKTQKLKQTPHYACHCVLWMSVWNEPKNIRFEFECCRRAERRWCGEKSKTTIFWWFQWFLIFVVCTRKKAGANTKNEHLNQFCWASGNMVHIHTHQMLD